MVIPGDATASFPRLATSPGPPTASNVRDLPGTCAPGRGCRSTARGFLRALSGITPLINPLLKMGTCSLGPRI